MVIHGVFLLVMGLWNKRKRQKSKANGQDPDIDQEKAFIYKEETRKNVSLACFIFALIGLFLAIVDLELIIASFIEKVIKEAIALTQRTSSIS